MAFQVAANGLGNTEGWACSCTPACRAPEHVHHLPQQLAPSQYLTEARTHCAGSKEVLSQKLLLHFRLTKPVPVAAQLLAFMAALGPVVRREENRRDVEAERLARQRSNPTLCSGTCLGHYSSPGRECPHHMCGSCCPGCPWHKDWHNSWQTGWGPQRY